MAGPDMSLPRPHWLKVKLPSGYGYNRLKDINVRYHLNTVCKSALCPNIGECWSRGTATFLIMGDRCTRNCSFCNISHGHPSEIDPEEPLRIALAVRDLGLRHAVITSVTRDDLEDGGASMFAQVVRNIRDLCPSCRIEILVPDFQGCAEALRIVLEEKPDILGHNLETVPRLYPIVRPEAVYSRSLQLLKEAKAIDPTIKTKSGIMLGLGECEGEILETMKDLRSCRCDILTIGQYLPPSRNHVQVKKYYSPEEFDRLKIVGKKMGFFHVESAPLVRSSYHAEEVT